MTRFPKLWVTKAWLASAFYSAIYLLISFCTVHCTYLSHWGFLTNAIYKVQTLHVKWCVNVMACWCHCLKQLPFSLGWLNSPRCWLAPLCKVGRPTRRLGDKERALPCSRGVPLTSSVDFTQRAPAPLLTSDVGNTRCVGQPSLLWWGCNCTNHFHVDLPTGLSDLADLGDSSGWDEHPSKRPIKLSQKQGWAVPA